MTRPPVYGLVAAGRITQSFLPRLPCLRERLGPVKSTSMRLASRIVNGLRAGHAAHSVEALARSKAVLVFVPDSRLAAAVEELTLLGHHWRGKAAILCGSQLDSRPLAPLARLGAAACSLNPIEGSGDRLFVAEGDRAAIRHARQLIGEPHGRLLTIHRDRKALYQAGLGFATSLFTPLIAAAVETLHAGGLPTHQAMTVAESQFQRSLRNYLKSGRRGWEGPLAGRDPESIRRQVEALFGASPLLAAYFYENAVIALRLFRKDPKWLVDLAPLPGAGRKGAAAAK